MSTGVLLVGALGRMGIEIASLLLEDKALKLQSCVEYQGHPKAGEDYGVCIGKGPLGIALAASVEAPALPGIIIDFSSPQSTRTVLHYASRAGIPVVAGTTGLGADDLQLAHKAAESIPLIVSPNMSLGVNLLFSLTELVASRLGPEFDIEIIEAHHRFKKDAPSGTARRLGEVAAQARNLSYENAVCHGRSGISETTRSPDRIGMHAVRGGDIVGDHTVLFAGIGERIELHHMAHNRSTFAQGAVVAAKWLIGKKPGFYTMRDVLGF